MKNTVKASGGCSCGHVTFDINLKPLLRACCHCTICQKFNDAPYADILIYDGKAIEEPTEGQVNYKSHKAKSPILRGKCSNCDDPVLEKSISGLKLWIVPLSAHSNKAQLPEPVAHIFYATRVADIDDNNPKYNGALKSNLVLGKHLLAAKIFKGRKT